MSGSVSRVARASNAAVDVTMVSAGAWNGWDNSEPATDREAGSVDATQEWLPVTLLLMDVRTLGSMMPLSVVSPVNKKTGGRETPSA